MRFVNDKELQKKIAENISNIDFSKSDEIKKLYELI